MLSKSELLGRMRVALQKPWPLSVLETTSFTPRVQLAQPHNAAIAIANKRSRIVWGMSANAALSGSGPKESQETPWPVPAVRLNAQLGSGLQQANALFKQRYRLGKTVTAGALRLAFLLHDQMKRCY